MISTYSRVRASGLPNGWPYHPSTTCGPDTPRPRIEPAVRQVVERQRGHRARAGVRADSCTIDVPSPIALVRAPHQASGVNASDPHASAAKTESKPDLSASATSSPTPSGGCAPQ